MKILLTAQEKCRIKMPNKKYSQDFNYDSSKLIF